MSFDGMHSTDNVMLLWAKSDPFHPLVCHLVDVGYVAQALLDSVAYRKVLERWSSAAGCPLEASRSWLAVLAALHDWGKAWPSFQCRRGKEIPSSLKNADFMLPGLDGVNPGLRHESISARWIYELLNERGWDRRAVRTVSSVLEAHHSRVEQTSSVSLSEFDTKHRWLELKDRICDLVFATFAPPDWRADFRDHSAAGMLLLGLTVWADWIASNTELFPLRWSKEEWAEYRARSENAARRAVAKLGLTPNVSRRVYSSFKEMWPDFEQPTPIQECAEELAERAADLGLVIIEAPMGEGKTEAAFYLASHLVNSGSGFYVALPTAATSNQMFRRVRELLSRMDPEGPSGVQLVHGMSWLVDEASPERLAEVGEDADETDRRRVHSWFLPRKRSLLSPFGVGTIDQALMAALYVRFGFLRLFGLAGKVLIIDEAHAYDAYMAEILVRLLRWCRTLDISVIVLSATLPRQRSERLIAEYLGGASHLDKTSCCETDENSPESLSYPLVTAVTKSGRILRRGVKRRAASRSIRVARHYGLLHDPHGTADLAVNLVGDQGCVCVIANTVDFAQRIYRSLRKRHPHVEAMLFHARFLAKHRQAIEDKVVECFGKASLKDRSDPDWRPRPRRMILVATQVVEQSLDLDFDLIISALAPIDLLLQRIGRLHRHVRPDRPITAEELHVLLPEENSSDFGRSEAVYSRYLLLRTYKVLEERWTLPEDFRRLIESVYDESEFEANSEFDAGDAQAGTWRAARERMREQINCQARKAKDYLIPVPDPSRFRLTRVVEPHFYDEEDADVRGYLHARTRHDEDSMRVLMVEADVWRAYSNLKTPPSRKELRMLLLQTVNVPRRWLSKTSGTEPFDDPQPAPWWLQAEIVVPLRANRWVGRKGAEEVIVEVDDALGVRRIDRGEAE